MRAKAVLGSILIAAFGAGIEQRAASYTKVGVRLVGTLAGGTGVNGSGRRALNTRGSLRWLRGNISQPYRRRMDRLLKGQGQVIGLLVTHLLFFLQSSEDHLADLR